MISLRSYLQPTELPSSDANIPISASFRLILSIYKHVKGQYLISFRFYFGRINLY